jgi:hypothetical protein
MVFITISTGVGGGIVCHGKLLSGNEGWPDISAIRWLTRVARAAAAGVLAA